MDCSHFPAKQIWQNLQPTPPTWTHPFPRWSIQSRRARQRHRRARPCHAPRQRWGARVGDVAGGRRWLGTTGAVEGQGEVRVNQLQGLRGFGRGWNQLKPQNGDPKQRHKSWMLYGKALNGWGKSRNGCLGNLQMVTDRLMNQNPGTLVAGQILMFM